MLITPYPHDGRLVRVIIDEETRLISIRDVRGALATNCLVQIPDAVRLIISPYCLPDEGHVVYFNVTSPTEWWGMCSGTGRRVIYKVKHDKYVLFDDKGHMTGSH